MKRDLLGLQDSLKHKYYSSPALTPIIKGNIDIPPISIKRIRASRKKLKWKVNKEDIKSIKYFIVYSYSDNDIFNPKSAKQIVSITGLNYISLGKSHVNYKQKRYYRVSAVDKFGNEGVVSEEVN